MAFYGHISRSMHEIVAGTEYYIKERRSGWGNWNSHVKIKAVAIRPNTSASPAAWFFRPVEVDTGNVQRSAEGVWGSVTSVDAIDAHANAVAAIRHINVEEFTSHITPWLDRINESERWREVLTATMSSYINVDFSTGHVNGKPDDHPITIQTTTAGLKRLCLALLGDELYKGEGRQT